MAKMLSVVSRFTFSVQSEQARQNGLRLATVKTLSEIPWKTEF